MRSPVFTGEVASSGATFRELDRWSCPESVKEGSGQDDSQFPRTTLRLCKLRTRALFFYGRSVK
jgi:hypothetical protein